MNLKQRAKLETVAILLGVGLAVVLALYLLIVNPLWFFLPLGIIAIFTVFLPIFYTLEASRYSKLKQKQREKEGKSFDEL